MPGLWELLALGVSSQSLLCALASEAGPLANACVMHFGPVCRPQMARAVTCRKTAGLPHQISIH